MRVAGLAPPAPPDHLANSGWKNWDESGIPDTPIFGLKSPVTSLPIYLPVTDELPRREV
jgi:hypothetical protein